MQSSVKSLFYLVLCAVIAISSCRKEPDVSPVGDEYAVVSGKKISKVIYYENPRMYISEDALHYNYKYDSAGKLLCVEYGSETDGIYNKISETVFEYDGNKLKSIKIGDQEHCSFIYGSGGRLSKVESESAYYGEMDVDCNYDNHGHLSTVENTGWRWVYAWNGDDIVRSEMFVKQINDEADEESDPGLEYSYKLQEFTYSGIINNFNVLIDGLCLPQWGEIKWNSRAIAFMKFIGSFPSLHLPVAYNNDGTALTIKYERNSDGDIFRIVMDGYRVWELEYK